MTEIFRFLFFTEISSYFLEESDRNFGEVLIRGGGDSWGGWDRREDERGLLGGNEDEKAPKTTFTHLEYGRDHGSDHQHKRKVIKSI
jgi:hypothetical protein